MKRLAIFILLASSPALAAAFGSATAWDVQTTGADTNGGAFDSGVASPGTNESLGSGTAVSITLATGTTGTSSPAITSTTHGPGNFVHIASGSGCTAGWYEILSQAAGVATFNTTMGSATDVCVGVLGGSLLTISQANTNSVASNSINIQAGTYTFTSSLAVAQSTISFIGYQTTHNDGGTKPLITTATNSTVLFNTGSSNGGTQIFSNLSLSNTAATSASGIWQLSGHGTTQTWVFVGDKFNGFTNAIDSSDVTPDDVAYIQISNTEIENSSGIAVAAQSGSEPAYVKIFGSYFHGNAKDLYMHAGSPSLAWLEKSIFVGTSATVDVQIQDGIVEQCTFANNANNNYVLSFGASSSFNSVSNTIFYGNTGISLGAGSTISGLAGSASGHSNAFGSNTTNSQNWVGSPGDVTLTANPFTNSGSGDYSLNSTAGGGALLKGTGFPGIFPGATSTGHVDIGAVQSAGSSSAGGNFGSSN